MGNGMANRGIGRLLAVVLALAAGACGGGQGVPVADDGVPGSADVYADPAAAQGGAAPGLWAGLRDAVVGGELVPMAIVDANGFGQPVEALRLQLPRDWRTRGGIAWNDGAECLSGQVRVDWAANSPDGDATLELWPAVVWQVQGTELPTDPCPVAPWRSVREFLEAAAAQARPGARVLDYSDWPGLADRARALVARDAEPATPGQERRFEAGRILIGHVAADGTEMREVLAASAGFSTLGSKTDGGVGRVIAYSAPNGRLDLAQFERIVDSFEEDPQWRALAQERLKTNVHRYYANQRRDIDAWHARRMAQINQRGEADRAAIRMGALRDVAAIRSQTHANTMATNDRIHARGVDGVLERNAYAGVDGRTVHSSIHGGERVFQDTRDPNRAWSTDDPYVDPPHAVELERIP